MGYCYRHAYFSNHTSLYELSEGVYQKFKQSENTYSHYGLLSVGWNGRRQEDNDTWKRYIETYATFMIGPSNIHFAYDTTSTGPQPQGPYGYLHPKDERHKTIHAMLILGLNLCIDMTRTTRRKEEE